MKGHLVELLATFWRAAHASPLDHFLKVPFVLIELVGLFVFSICFVCDVSGDANVCVQLSALLRAEPDNEEADEDEQQRLALTVIDGKGVDLAEFNPQYVLKRVTAALGTLPPLAKSILTCVIFLVQPTFGTPARRQRPRF